jgi:hypothetical protein
MAASHSKNRYSDTNLEQDYHHVEIFKNLSILCYQFLAKKQLLKKQKTYSFINTKT